MSRFRLAIAGLACFAFALLPSGAAHAHSDHVAEPTNYRSEIKSVDPVVEGLSFEIVTGNQMQVTNTTSTELVLHGYQNEPYLRIGPDGLFVNTRSPAFYLNESEDGDSPVPAVADSNAEPEWHKQSASTTVVWHDHRVHWMSDQDPPLVAQDPNRVHVVIEDWNVTGVYGAAPVSVKGDLTWFPPPSALPWYALATLAFLLAFVPLFITRRLALVIAVLTVLICIDVVHTVGVALDTTVRDVAGAVETGLPAVIAWTVGVIGIRRLREGTDDGLWYSLFSAALIALLGGVQAWSSLTSSQPVFAFDPVLARIAISCSLGAGVGLVVALVLMLKSQRREPAAEAIGTEN